MNMQTACREASVERLWTFCERLCTNTVDTPQLATANAVMRASLRARSRKTSYLKDETTSVLVGLTESQQNTLAQMGAAPFSRATQRSFAARAPSLVLLNPLHVNCLIMDDYTTSTRSGAVGGVQFATSCNTISNVAIESSVLATFELSTDLPTTRLLNGTMFDAAMLAPILQNAVLDRNGLLDLSSHSAPFLCSQCLRR